MVQISRKGTISWFSRVQPRALFSSLKSIGDIYQRTLLWALFFAILCGVSGIGQPLEDIIVGGRDALRSHNSDGQIVVVGLDNKTVQKFGMLHFPSRFNAEVVDKLFALGAKSIAIDRFFSEDSIPKDDNAFAAALARHKGLVALGSIQTFDKNGKSTKLLGPNKVLSSSAYVAALEVEQDPFTTELPFARAGNPAAVQSMSAFLAHKSFQDTSLYRPDYSIRARSIPTLSFADVFSGHVSQTEIRGKDIIIGPVATAWNDTHSQITEGVWPGVYYQAIGAETLKHGTPIYWGWLPAFLIILPLSLLNLYAKRRREIVWSFVGTALALGLIPLILDTQLITVDTVPSLVLFGIIAYRARNIRNSLRSSVEGLPNLDALLADPKVSTSTLIAMKVTNHALIGASFSKNAMPDLFKELVRRIRISEPNTKIYHHDDMLFWLSATPFDGELAEHLEGLHALCSARVNIDDRHIDVQTTFGIDCDLNRAIQSRVNSATLSAEEADVTRLIWCLYDPSRQNEAAMQLQMLGDMERGLMNGRVTAAYQPKLDLATNTVVGVEALARWNHPSQGDISPSVFVAAAERYNRTKKLTKFMLETAVRDIVKINNHGLNLSVSVNVPVQLLLMSDFVELVMGVVEYHKIKPDRLILEITERGSLGDSEVSKNTMARLIELGVQLSIDDYGTLNATLAYLKSIPASEVKIDQQFIKTMSIGSDDYILVESTISAAHLLGRRVVAEGVESEGVLRILKDMGCDMAQGFHISRPLSIVELRQFMQFKDRRTMMS